MKKLLLIVVLLLLLLLTNCPDNGTPAKKTSVYGMIVDQNGVGLEGVSVTLSNYELVTDATGKFARSNVRGGTFELRAHGGSDRHYLIAPASVVVKKNKKNNLGSFTAYHLQGQGVIIESYYAGRASVKGVTLSKVKERSLYSSRIDADEYGDKRAQSQVRAASSDFINDNIALLALQWEKPVGQTVAYYTVALMSGETVIPVWNSSIPQAEDPAFAHEAPACYLDLDNELAGRVSQPGSYRFVVKAFDESYSEILSYPEVDVCFGMFLGGYATNIVTLSTGISWDAVENAQGYRVRLYEDDIAGSLAYSSGDELLGDSTMDMIGVTVGTGYYGITVDAVAVDECGWPLEVTRGIGGMTVSP